MRVVTGDQILQQRCVENIASNRTDLVKRRRKSNQTVARDGAIGWLGADGAGDRSREPNRTTCVCFAMTLCPLK